MEKKIRIFLADTSRDYLTVLRDALDEEPDMVVTGASDNGGEAWALLSKELPDVLVTDLLLPRLDGLSLIRALRDQGTLPHTVVLSGFVNVHMAEELSRIGVDDYLQKPCETDRLIRRIREAVDPESPRHMFDYEASIQMALKRFGIPPHLHGRYYLLSAIQMAIEDAGVLHGITKSLYPAIARRYHTNPSCVERSIRSAIRSGWNETTPAERQAYFGALFDDLERPLGNARFIAAIAEHIRSTYERINPCSPPRERSQRHFYN